MHLGSLPGALIAGDSECMCSKPHTPHLWIKHEQDILATITSHACMFLCMVYTRAMCIMCERETSGRSKELPYKDYIHWLWRWCHEGGGGGCFSVLSIHVTYSMHPYSLPLLPACLIDLCITETAGEARGCQAKVYHGAITSTLSLCTEHGLTITFTKLCPWATKIAGPHGRPSRQYRPRPNPMLLLLLLFSQLSRSCTSPFGVVQNRRVCVDR